MGSLGTSRSSYMTRYDLLTCLPTPVAVRVSPRDSARGSKAELPCKSTLLVKAPLVIRRLFTLT